MILGVPKFGIQFYQWFVYKVIWHSDETASTYILDCIRKSFSFFVFHW